MSVRRDYVCTECSYIFEHQHKSVSDKLKKRCPNCGKKKLETYFGNYQVTGYVYNDPTTFQHQAERNSKKKPHLAELHKEHQKQDFEAKTGMDYEESKKEAEKINKINKMSPEQQEKYLMTGDM